jgi:predicted Fe-Mo cluster-binding NifX family protein
MKIVIPINANNLEAEISTRFSRSPFYAIIDKTTKVTHIIPNQFVDQKSGAGKAIVDYLVNNYNVTSFAALEIGLKVQEIATKKKIQLIILHSQTQKLKQVQTLMN